MLARKRLGEIVSNPPHKPAERGTATQPLAFVSPRTNSLRKRIQQRLRVVLLGFIIIQNLFALLFALKS